MLTDKKKSASSSSSASKLSSSRSSGTKSSSSSTGSELSSRKHHHHSHSQRDDIIDVEQQTPKAKSKSRLFGLSSNKRPPIVLLALSAVFFTILLGYAFFYLIYLPSTTGVSDSDMTIEDEPWYIRWFSGTGLDEYYDSAAEDDALLHHQAKEAARSEPAEQAERVKALRLQLSGIVPLSESEVLAAAEERERRKAAAIALALSRRGVAAASSRTAATAHRNTTKGGKLGSSSLTKKSTPVVQYSLAPQFYRPSRFFVPLELPEGIKAEDMLTSHHANHAPRLSPCVIGTERFHDPTECTQMDQWKDAFHFPAFNKSMIDTFHTNQEDNEDITLYGEWNKRLKVPHFPMSLYEVMSPAGELALNIFIDAGGELGYKLDEVYRLSDEEIMMRDGNLTSIQPATLPATATEEEKQQAAMQAEKKRPWSTRPLILPTTLHVKMDKVQCAVQRLALNQLHLDVVWGRSYWKPSLRQDRNWYNRRWVLLRFGCIATGPDANCLPGCVWRMETKLFDQGVATRAIVQPQYEESVAATFVNDTARYNLVPLRMELNLGLPAAKLGPVGAQCFLSSYDLEYKRIYCDSMKQEAQLPMTVALESRKPSKDKKTKDEDKLKPKKFEEPFSSSYLYPHLHYSPTHRYVSLVQAGGWGYTSASVGLDNNLWMAGHSPYVEEENVELKRAEAAMKEGMKAQVEQVLAKSASAGAAGAHDKDEFVRTGESYQEKFSIVFDDKHLDWYKPLFTRNVVLQMAVEGNAFRKPIPEKHYDTTSFVGGSHALGTATSWILAIVGKTASDLMNHKCLVPLLNPPTLPSLRLPLSLWNQRRRAISNGKQIRLLKIHSTDAQNLVEWDRAHNFGVIYFGKGWYGKKMDQAYELAESYKAVFNPKEVSDYGRHNGIHMAYYLHASALKHTSKVQNLGTTYEAMGASIVCLSDFEGGITEPFHYRFLMSRIIIFLEHGLWIKIDDASLKPRGLQRTLPNLLSYQGLRDQEYKNEAFYHLNAFYNRMLAGPADYHFRYQHIRNTLGAKSTEKTSNTIQYQRVTLAHQLALPLFLYSPSMQLLNHDSIKDINSAYNNLPEIYWWYRLPPSFDDTRMLGDGEVGEWAVTARRSKDDWFIGGITNSKSRTLLLNLTDVFRNIPDHDDVPPFAKGGYILHMYSDPLDWVDRKVRNMNELGILPLVSYWISPGLLRKHVGLQHSNAGGLEDRKYEQTNRVMAAALRMEAAAREESEGMEAETGVDPDSEEMPPVLPSRSEAAASSVASNHPPNPTASRTLQLIPSFDKFSVTLAPQGGVAILITPRNGL